MNLINNLNFCCYIDYKSRKKATLLCVSVSRWSYCFTRLLIISNDNKDMRRRQHQFFTFQPGQGTFNLGHPTDELFIDDVEHFEHFEQVSLSHQVGWNT